MEKRKKSLFTLELAVRDYECDTQGIVNNAIYQHYLEHTRHQFLKHIGLDFGKLHSQGADPVVSRVEIDYKYSLRSGDAFVVALDLHREGTLRFVFDQDIYSVPDGRQILSARVYIVFVSNGRPIRPPAEVVEAIERFSG